MVLPVLSAATLLGLGGYLCWSFYTSADHFEISPDNGWFILLSALIVASGFLAAAWAKWVRKSPYFVTGPRPDADPPQLFAVQRPRPDSRRLPPPPQGTASCTPTSLLTGGPVLAPGQPPPPSPSPATASPPSAATRCAT